MEPSPEEPAQLPPKQAAPEEAPGPSQQDTMAEDPVPRPITLQDIRSYLKAADEEERTLIRAELTPDTREATAQLLRSRVAGVSRVKPLLFPSHCQQTLMVVCH